MPTLEPQTSNTEDTSQGTTQPQVNTGEVWKIAIEQLRMKISPQNFSAWFKNTSLVNVDSGIATIQCPSNFAREWLDSNHNKLIRNILADITKKDLEVIFIVGNSGATDDSGNDRYQYMHLSPDEAPLFNIDNTYRSQLENAVQKAFLNPIYTFDNFVVGPSNRVAHAAAEAVSDNPGSSYNPLFIYGGVGLGKTHLGQAVGHRIIANDPGKRVLYCPSETFLNEMVEAIRSEQTPEFRQNYRKLDMLIIDDIQFISKWQAAQEELFHTFNTLHQSGKQIILMSDRPPAQIDGLTDRLRSRFLGGMVADVTSPDYELRIAIVKQKAQDRGLMLPDKLLVFIAEAFDDNIRELEGALIKIATHSKICGTVPTEDEAAKILAIDPESKRQRVSPKEVIREVCKVFGVSVRDIRGSRRLAEFVEPRQVCMYLLRKELGLPLEQVAHELNRNDHTTVLHAVERVEERLEVDEDFTSKVKSVEI